MQKGRNSLAFASGQASRASLQPPRSPSARMPLHCITLSPHSQQPFHFPSLPRMRLRLAGGVWQSLPPPPLAFGPKLSVPCFSRPLLSTPGGTRRGGMAVGRPRGDAAGRGKGEGGQGPVQPRGARLRCWRVPVKEPVTPRMMPLRMIRTASLAWQWGGKWVPWATGARSDPGMGVSGAGPGRVARFRPVPAWQCCVHHPARSAAAPPTAALQPPRCDRVEVPVQARNRQAEVPTHFLAGAREHVAVRTSGVGGWVEDGALG